MNDSTKQLEALQQQISVQCIENPDSRDECIKEALKQAYNQALDDASGKVITKYDKELILQMRLV